jgi:UDP-4-amino-4,6-dideoxy-N-acetyl-beta-L-altrosamine transaminase
VAKFYSYGKQTIEQDDIDAVVNVLKGNWLTQGPYVKQFENDLAEKLEAGYVSVVSNGTAALHLAALALGWDKNDIIITSPITFAASMNCALYTGATPDFVDIDPVSYTIDTGRLEEKLKTYSKTGKKVKAVVAVDYAGHPCDWKSLKELSLTYNFQLVNDNCHALGAAYLNDTKYAAKYADAIILSFHPVKHITTGEGGAVLTNNSKLDETIKELRTHGIVKDNSKFRIQNSELTGPWYYEMQQLGFNYRLTDFQCALGSSQLKKLDGFVSRRNEIAQFYNEQFRMDEKFIIPKVEDNIKHAFHLYPLQIKFDNLKISKKDYFEKLRENRIGLQVHYIPVHLQPFYRKNYGFKKGNFPIAEEFYKMEVSIPMYPLLGKDDLKYIVGIIKEYAV